MRRMRRPTWHHFQKYINSPCESATLLSLFLGGDIKAVPGQVARDQVPHALLRSRLFKVDAGEPRILPPPRFLVSDQPVTVELHALDNVVESRFPADVRHGLPIANTGKGLARRVCSRRNQVANLVEQAAADLVHGAIIDPPVQLLARSPQLDLQRVVPRRTLTLLGGDRNAGLFPDFQRPDDPTRIPGVAICGDGVDLP